ncbi:MAG: hypothetical protein JWM10_1477 [Myxococcaceae bacterium]|nr:hypothetical protein [Myxococcaceae bacterium]
MDPQSPPYAEHQRFLATLRSRLQGQTLWLRLATLAGVSAWVLVHGQSPEARYLFVAPLLALAGGALELGLARRDLLLGALARVPTTAVDLELVEPQVPWRRALLRSAAAWLYAPTAVLAAAITIDTLAARPGWEGQTIWMVALALSVIAAYTGLLGAWWLERFGEPAATTVGATQLRIAAGVGFEAPRAETAGGAAVQRTPSLVPAEATPGPFPVKRAESTTQSFGTPLT